MFDDLQQLPVAAWATIVRWTLFATVGSVAISVAVSHAILSAASNGLSAPGLAAAVTLPILLGTPVIFYHLLRLQQLRLANEKLQILASTDWLTTCLNRRAFTHLVSDRLEDAEGGALLVIDADHFKVINDSYGHDRGDEALQLIADTITANLAEGDVVGRIGGEEFGVLLLKPGQETARLVGERIRRAVAEVQFAPDGRMHPLSVSVGAACFDGCITFTDLFRVADQLLYKAKQKGRNRVEVAHVDDHPSVRVAASPLTEAAA